MNRTQPGAFARHWVIAVAAAGLVLAVALVWPWGGQRSELPEPLQGLDARGAVALANQWAVRGEGVTTFVTSEAVHFEWPDGRKAQVPLEGDAMYVAVAPYVHQTHPCRVHYISSCRAELAEVPLRVTARDQAGRVVLQQTVTTLPNGFFELWLPRGMELALTIEWPEAGLVGQGRIETVKDARTCVTDIQLAAQAAAPSEG
ncbi:MAG TPA: CueP family metal-binding protein [Limnochordales bacterium]